ncbi:MAG: hypothetical protein WC942_06915 [Clostridia bacterium]|jgi:hypothetical protein
MVTALHKDHGSAEGIHQIHNWNFINESARLNHIYYPKDIGKAARQLDSNTFWLLINNSPVSFIQISGGSSSGLDEITHASLRQLIHMVHNGPFEGFSGAIKEILPIENPFPTQIIWWSNTNKTEKIAEKIIIRNTQQFPTLITYNIYDGEFIISTAIDTIEYSGAFEINRERVIL